MQAYVDCAEATGSRWKLVEASGRNYRKLEVCVEFMEVKVFTTSIEAPTTSMERSINLHEKKTFLWRKYRSRFVKRVKIVWRHRGVLSQTVKLNSGQNTRKVHFRKFGRKKRQDNRQDNKKKSAQKYMVAVACRSCRVYVKYYYLNLGGRTWSYIGMSQIPGNSGREDKY